MVTTAQRFRQALHATWLALPVAYRRLLCTHWRPHGPRIQLLPDWPGRAADCCWADYWDDAGDGRPRFRFWQWAVARLPDALLQALVAHELGHAYLAAIGVADWRTAEERVDRQAIRWGFDLPALRRFQL